MLAESAVEASPVAIPGLSRTYILELARTYSAVLARRPEGWLVTVTVSCTDIQYTVLIFSTVLDGCVGGCCGGQDEPARSVQSASHDGTDPPKLTFEARLTTLTLKVVPSGRLLRPRFREAEKA